VIAVAADKNQSQRIGLANIRLEKYSFVVIAVAALGILTSRQGWIIRNGRWNRVQYISHFLFQIIAINQGLVRGCLGVSAQAT
jgi:hypothetical protein